MVKQRAFVTDGDPLAAAMGMHNDSMFRRSRLLLLGAGLTALLAACHPAKPATSPIAPSSPEQVNADTTADQDRSAKEIPGYVPQASQPAHKLTTRPTAPAAAPAPARTPQDDPMRQFDNP